MHHSAAVALAFTISLAILLVINCICFISSRTRCISIKNICRTIGFVFIELLLLAAITMPFGYIIGKNIFGIYPPDFDSIDSNEEARYFAIIFGIGLANIYITLLPGVVLINLFYEYIVKKCFIKFKIVYEQVIKDEHITVEELKDYTTLDFNSATIVHKYYIENFVIDVKNF